MIKSENPTDPRLFWPTQNLYPEYLLINGNIMSCILGRQVPEWIGKFLQKETQIPQDGWILDICSGATSHLLLGKEKMSRTIAWDISPALLDKSHAAVKILGDICHRSIPDKYITKIRFATFINSIRYFNGEERQQIFQNIHQLLAPDSKIFITDQESSAMASLVGEVRTFEPAEVTGQLVREGFQIIRSDRIELHLYNPNSRSYYYYWQPYIFASV
jgi:hypothetical protein